MMQLGLFNEEIEYSIKDSILKIDVPLELLLIGACSLSIVIDLSVEISVFGDKNESETEIVRSVIEAAIQYFSIDKRKMGDPLFIGDLFKEIGTLSGVVSVTEIKVFGKVRTRSTVVGGNATPSSLRYYKKTSAQGSRIHSLADFAFCFVCSLPSFSKDSATFLQTLVWVKVFWNQHLEKFKINA